MTDRLYAPLRGALETLATGDAPPDLAATALRRAHRRRVATRSAGVVAAGVALVAAVPAVLAAVAPSPAHLAPGVPAAGSVVAAYQRVDPDGGATDPGPANDSTLMLNFGTGAYELLPYAFLRPSPDYRQAAVSVGDNSAAHPSRWGVLDLATRNVRWLPDNPLRGYEQSPVWSPEASSPAPCDGPYRRARSTGCR